MCVFVGFMARWSGLLIRSEPGCRGKLIVVELEGDWRGVSGIGRMENGLSGSGRVWEGGSMQSNSVSM